MEHLTTLATDPTCGEALASLITTLVKGEVPNKIADLLSSATLVVLLNKDAETLAQLKLARGDAYLKPQRSHDMGSTLEKVCLHLRLAIH